MYQFYEVSLKFVPKVRINSMAALSHNLNYWWLVYWRIYGSLGLNELKRIKLYKVNNLQWFHSFVDEKYISKILCIIYFIDQYFGKMDLCLNLYISVH